VSAFADRLRPFELICLVQRRRHFALKLAIIFSDCLQKPSFGHVRLDPRLPLAPPKLHAMSCNDLGALPGVFDVRPGTFKYKYNRRVHADDAHDISTLLRASLSPADYPLLGLSLVI
jgi:hypothetical protein